MPDLAVPVFGAMCWLLFELWVRQGPAKLAAVEDTWKRSGGEGPPSHRAQIRVPADPQISVGVKISREQFDTLGAGDPLEVHVRTFAGLTVVRAAGSKPGVAWTFVIAGLAYMIGDWLGWV